MTLYEIDKQIGELLIFAAEQELTEDEIKDTLNSLVMDRVDKIDNIACYYKNLLSDVEALKAEENKLADRRKAKENKAEGLKRYLSSILEGQRFETARVKVSFRKSDRVAIDDPTKLSEDYLRYSEPTADKTAIKEALKAGKEVAGAHLEQNLSMTIK